jgi:hypothetical protein
MRFHLGFCFAISFSLSALAGESWTCKLTDQTIACSSSGQNSARIVMFLEKKMDDVVKLSPHCPLTDCETLTTGISVASI